MNVNQRRLAAVIGLVGVVMSLGGVAAPVTAQERGASCPPVCLTADEDRFTGEATVPTSGREIGPRGRPGPASPLVTQTRYVPTCSENSGLDGAVLCELATTACADANQTRYWIFQRVLDTRIPGDNPPFVRVLQPPFVCLGPDDPALDPLAAIPALVEREFQRVVVLKGVAEVSPRPETLVNIESIFTATAPARYEIPLTLLGQSVVITATAESWTWHFGDGATTTVTDKTSQGRTTHVYTRAGSLPAHVVISWSGTFRIGADPTVRQVQGTATTTGDPVEVAVQQARSELVDSPG